MSEDHDSTPISELDESTSLNANDEFIISTKDSNEVYSSKKVKLSTVQNASPAAGITVKEEGTALATNATSLNFVGSTVTASGTGAEKTITITEPAGGIQGITVKEEGTVLATDATSLNFVGSTVTASGTGAEKTITISEPAGGGGGSGPFVLGSVFRVENTNFTGNNGGVGDPGSLHTILGIQTDGSATVAGTPVSPNFKYSVVSFEFTRFFNYLNASNTGGYMGSNNYDHDNGSTDPGFWINSGVIPTYHRASNMVRTFSQRGLEIGKGIWALIYDNQLYFGQARYHGQASNDFHRSNGNYIVAVTN